MKLRSLRVLVAGAILILLSSASAWADFVGDVVRVIDGDTVVVLVDRREVRVRLADIDAPERGQAFGSRSRQALAGMVFRQQVEVIEKGSDQYGRTLGVIHARHCASPNSCVVLNVNARMVHAGMAWAYRYRDRPTDLEMYALEQDARHARRGLWSNPNAQEPWKWRRSQERSTTIEAPQKTEKIVR